MKELGASQLISQSFLETEVDEAKENLASLSNVIPRFRSTLRVRIDSSSLTGNVTDSLHTGWRRATLQSAAATQVTDIYTRRLQRCLICPR